MNDENNYIGNISTIASWVSILLYPVVIKYVQIDNETLTTFIYTLIVICIAIWSSYNPNTFKFLHNNNECDCAVLETEEDLINEEYISNDDDGC